jgi:hypothetical protein
MVTAHRFHGLFIFLQALALFDVPKKDRGWFISNRLIKGARPIDALQSRSFNSAVGFAFL